MSNLTPQLKKKLMDAADIVKKGDVALFKKLLEYQDLFDNFRDEIIKFKKEVVSSKDFSLVVDTIIKKIDENYSSVEKIKDNLEKSIENGDKINDSKIKSIYSDLNDKINFVKGLIPELPKMPDIGSLKLDFSNRIEKIQKLIPSIEIQTPEIIKNKLESLEGNDRIDKSAIKGLDEEFKRVEDRISNIPRGNIGGTGRTGGMQMFDLSSQTNGSLKVFTVPKNKNGMVIGSDFPTVLMENNGFTLNGSRTQVTLTQDNAPSQGSQLVFLYTSIFNT